MKVSYHKYIVLFIIIAISFAFQFKNLNEFPQYKHSWAQSDRYALAIGFINNGGDFFHPQSFIYNNQFPDGYFLKIFNTTITSVDFPIYDYMVSIIMRVFGTTDPWCFRIFVFLYSIIGLFFLYKLTTLFTNSIIKSIGVVLFAISSPTFLYYQAGFLPTIPSLANCVIALYFLFSFYKFGDKKNYYISIFFLTLATLARLPFAIVLIAVICMEILYVFKNKKTYLFKWIPIVFSVVFVFSYYLYNTKLRAEHGSLFLNYIIPASNWQHLKEFIKVICDKWMFKYFSLIHYFLLVFLGIIFICKIIYNKNSMTELHKKLFVLCLILFFGCTLYYLLMAFQFLNHDYYFLDTFYLPIVCTALLLIVFLPAIEHQKIKFVLVSVFLMVFIPAFLYAKKIQKAEKTELGFTVQKTTAENFKDADKFLDAIKIPKDSKILVLAADGPNNPFILMKRKGFSMIYTEQDKIEAALKWPYDYVVVENSKLMNIIYSVYPNITNQLLKIASNNDISVFVKKTNNERSDLSAFFNLNTKQMIYRDRINFNKFRKKSNWTSPLSSFSFSGNMSGFVRPHNDFGFSHRIKKFAPLNLNSSILRVEGYFMSKSKLKQCLMCVTIKSEDKDILFLTYDLSQLEIDNHFNKQQILFYLPKIKNIDFELTTFIWNTGKNKLFYDDFEVAIFQ